ncbi:MAG: DUF4160 domain-containing protein [Rhodoferax sp.]|uniref:DUF4160 domain-containing protein n=1 Tax=Rhodoferax sp. TaxID=50421 RepID=UPI003BB6725F|nr:DUF4160 domain-containing protein [Rhodoferax sp.]
MPTICLFYGILVKMYWDDHAPPHFHVEYAEYRAQYQIETLELLRGTLPRRAHALILEWAALHRAELMENWKLCESKQHPKAISPLL